MSDVTVAPQGDAPAAPANEVVINESPVSSPNPVGSQAPDKADSGNDGRREAIQRAFERAQNPPPKTERPAPKKAEPAEAKPGHNKPPEETEKFDLKKRPSDQPSAQPRDRGRFAPRASDANAPAQAATQPPQPPRKQLPEGAPFRDPPPRISERAKIDWADTPETVRGDFHRIQQEFGAAYQQYRGAYEAMKPIKHFHQMAKQQGTTLERALTNFVSIEQKLRSDPIGGLDVIINNLGLEVPDENGGMRRAGLRDIAYTVLSQSPDQLKLTQNQNAQTAASHQIGALHQEVVGLKKTLQQMHTAQQFTYTRSAVDQFADTHPGFDELGDLIESELKFGFDLETAYRRAKLLRPTTHAAQTRTTSAQTRPADKSISGAPVTASNAAAKSEKKVGRREAIQNAMNRMNGSL